MRPGRIALLGAWLCSSSAACPSAHRHAGGDLGAGAPAVARIVARDPYAAHIAEASQRFGIPTALDTGRHAHRERGRRARRLAQGRHGLDADHARNLGRTARSAHRLGSDPYDPHDNILAGAAYLRELYDRYGSPGFLAAYNAGPGRYEDYLAGPSAAGGDPRLCRGASPSDRERR